MLTTRLTKALGIRHPIIQAPMAFAAGGRLAAAVSSAGGLGLIGGAYGDSKWIEQQFREAGNQPVGCGLITWSLKPEQQVLEAVLEHEPVAIFLSFGDPETSIETIRQYQSGKHQSNVICQVQTLRDATHAVNCGADIVVAQGAEAGGHGESRATMTLVPEIADMLSRESAETLLCAAGGIADGRSLAASLMLGADGVVMGSRFWASSEAIVHPLMLAKAIEANGDNTLRSSVMDIARKLDWPERYTARVLKNNFTDQWHSDIQGLIKNSESEAARWQRAWTDGDTDTANTFVGEACGLIKSVEPAESIVNALIQETEGLIRGASVNMLNVP